MQIFLDRWSHRVVLLSLLILLYAAPVGAHPVGLWPQQPAAGQASPNVQTKPKSTASKRKWRVKVLSKESPIIVRLQAAEAPLTEVVADLSHQLNIPIMLSPVMKAQQVSVDPIELPLESALRLLAPQVFIDRLIVGGVNSTQILAIYLGGVNESDWLSAATVQGISSQVMLIEGDTDDLFNPPAVNKEGGEDERPIKVSYAHDRLTVHARKQPLSVVLFEIARVMNVPFDIQRGSGEVVDVDFSGLPIEQVILSLPPSVSLYVRTNALTTESTPLRLVLGATDQQKLKP
jgi:hypothetical protein